MPKVNTIKGMHSLKTLNRMQKNAIPEKQNADYIKLYMFEKEKKRLLNEQSRISLRLEIIQTRLKEIQDFYTEKSKLLQKQDYTSKEENNQEGRTFKTMSIDY